MPLCADESCQTSNLPVREQYQCINIKLDRPANMSAVSASSAALRVLRRACEIARGKAIGLPMIVP
jgi:hypothetical protein